MKCQAVFVRYWAEDGRVCLPLLACLVPFYKHGVGNLALYNSVSIFPLPSISYNRKTEVDSYSPGPAEALSTFQKPARYHRCWISLSVLGEKTMFNPQFLVSVSMKIFLSF